MTYPNPFPPPRLPRGWHRYDPTCRCAGCERGEPSSAYMKVPKLDVADMSYEEVRRADEEFRRANQPNVAAIIAISAALIGLLVLPILLGPAAIVAAIVGEHQARTEGRKLMKVSLLAFIIGIGITLHAVLR